MSDSRISGLYRLSVAERIGELERHGWLSESDAELLRSGRHTLLPATADRIIENVVGVFGLPLGIAPNFRVNGRDYLVPMVVEEPSIVAGTSKAAMLARDTGGITAESTESLLAGQVYVTEIDDVEGTLDVMGRAQPELLELASSVHPRLTERGGGVRDIECHAIELAGARAAIAVHLLVDTGDAMGANLVNSICEVVAPRIAELCGGNVALRILSNLSDRSLVTARVRYRLDADTRDRIVLASDIAAADPYRAATHNKGIMNGIDALAIATGNDWRAIEAGAHAYAALTGTYKPLATWSVADDGDLLGEMTIPLKVGTVGGTRDANTSAAIGLHITGVEAARELAELMAAVGLAQNFAALHALATTGIQAGHMKLHARSVVEAAGVPDELFDEVLGELIDSGEIKTWKAAEILAAKQDTGTRAGATAAGKVILLGEHAVVYGKHALAVPILDAVSATVSAVDETSTIAIREWGVAQPLAERDTTGIGAAAAKILEQFGIPDSGFAINVHSRLPVAMGLGSSAALAVAIVRAFNDELDLGLDDARVNEIAFECEKLAHGTPSGIDNTLATYSKAMLFRNAGKLEVTEVPLAEPLPLIIACSSQSGMTKELVAGVRRRRDERPASYDAIFEQMDALSLNGAESLSRGDYASLGAMMNVCHGLLNAIGVSTPELESMVGIARAAGAVGAKLTGAGGGGSIVALCPDKESEVRSALTAAGFRTIGLSQDQN